MRCDAMRCDAMRCDAMRCDAMRCDAMRCDGMGCDAMRNAMNPVEIPALRLDREFRQTEFRFQLPVCGKRAYIAFSK